MILSACSRREQGQLILTHRGFQVSWAFAFIRFYPVKKTQVVFNAGLVVKLDISSFEKALRQLQRSLDYFHSDLSP
jgi:hypothetical protein